MWLKKLVLFFLPGNILDPFNIFGGGKKPEIPREKQPTAGGFKHDGVGSSASGKPPGSSNGDAILNIPEGLDGTTQGKKHHLKPIGEIEEGQNMGQYPGDGVPTEPSRSTQNLPDTGIPLLAKQSQSSKPLEIVKSIVYGGLLESVTSLSIVSSAAACGATTLNIVALGLANLIGGLVVLFHSLKDLRYEESIEAKEVKSRYQKLLGRKENFLLHATFALLSYVVFGLAPPAVYGFTFRQTDDGDFKLLAVAASTLGCIFILAIMKAYTQGQHRFMAYSKTVTYYIIGAVMASGISYAIGHLSERFMDDLGWFHSEPVQQLSAPENKLWVSF